MFCSDLIDFLIAARATQKGSEKISRLFLNLRTVYWHGAVELIN